jgi:hypothetical protein
MCLLGDDTRASPRRPNRLHASAASWSGTPPVDKPRPPPTPAKPPLAGVDLGELAGVDLGELAGVDLGELAGADLGAELAGVDLGESRSF